MDGREDLAEPMRSRWSPSVFDETHQLDDGTLETLLQAARWAPSWGDLSPWVLLVARRGSPAHGVVVARLRRGNAGWAPRASVLLLGLARVAADPADPDRFGTKGELEAAYDLGQAVAHLTLQAHASGLAAHQLGGFDRDAVATGLDVPVQYRLLTAVAVGMRPDPADLAEVAERDRSGSTVRGVAVRWPSWSTTVPGVAPGAGRLRSMTSLRDFSATGIDGQEVDLATYDGDVVLVVNTASQCGFTSQYQGLQKLQDTYADRGFTVLGFPCDQFRNQEPGSDAEIAGFCERTFGVTFPMFSKIDVNGETTHPLYAWLKAQKGGLLGRDIRWNFTKYLLDAQGRVVKRYAPATEPAKLTGDIEKALSTS